MTTLELAKRKWARKMARAGPIWKRRVTDKSDEYAKGMSDFLGITVPVTHERVRNWKEGVDAVSADDFAAAVRGKEDKWADRLKEAFS